MDGANQAAFLKMHCVIKCLLDTQNLRSMLDPSGSEKEPWNIICFSNGDYAEDPVTWRSISGFILYVLGVPMPWQAMAQRSVTLS